MMAASACLDYALLWFALWWGLFGESITESDVIPKRRAGDGWIAGRPAQPGLLRAAVPDCSARRHSAPPRLAWRWDWPLGSTDFDLAGWMQSRIRECRQHLFVRRALWPGLGAPFAGRSVTLGVPPAGRCVRISMPSSGTSKASSADNRAMTRTFSPSSPRHQPRRQSRCHGPGRSWPIFIEGRSGAGVVG